MTGRWSCFVTGMRSAHFVSLINDDPPRRRVLYLHGLGGNGKSLLLRFLVARCCVRLPPGEWERVRGLPEAELPAALGGVAKVVQVPVARIDFGARPVGEMRPQECFSALFMLKQQLSGFRVTTPRFDFAAVTYLHKLGFDLGRRLPELFPRRETRSALGRAETMLGALDPGSVTASAFGYSESQFRFHEGSAYTRLGDTRSALRAQERAMQTCPPGDYTDWALTRLDRASCLARDGDPVAAVAYATKTLTGLSGEQSQGIIARRGRALVRDLPASYRAIPAVRELSELLPAAGARERP
jgi:hypothetical protein